MSHPLITFMVRTKDRANVSEIGERVAKALNLNFAPSDASRFKETEALEASALGIEISVSYWPPLEEGQLRTYQITGYPMQDVLSPWKEVFDISEFILTIMARRDGGEWYIPDATERRRELMLDK